MQFKARFVDEVKFAGTDKAYYEKSRLVVQGYDDRGKKEILTQSPTIQRASQRILAIWPRPFIMTISCILGPPPQRAVGVYKKKISLCSMLK